MYINSMNIGLISHMSYPWNRGVYLVSSALHDSGHNVVIMCARKNSEQNILELDYGTVYYFPFLSKRMFWNRLASLHWGINPFWVFWIYKMVRRECLDVLCVRDLPLVPSALMVKKILGIPVVFDMREGYPEMHANAPRTKLVHHITRSKRLLEVLERYALSKADQIMVVIEEQAERLESIGVSTDKIFINITTPYKAVLDDSDPETIRSSQEQLRVVYAGELSKMRGIHLVVDAIHGLFRKGINVEFTVIGEGAEKDNLIKLVEEKSIGHLVKFRGYLKPDDVISHLSEYDVGIIANEPNGHTHTTVPGKLFEYMAAGLPVIASSVRPVARIVRDHKIGYIFDEYSVESLTETLFDVHHNKAHMDSMRRRAREAIRSYYNWDYQGRAVVSAVESCGI